MDPEYVQVAFNTRDDPSWTQPRYSYRGRGLPVVVGRAAALDGVAELLAIGALDDDCVLRTSLEDTISAEDTEKVEVAELEVGRMIIVGTDDSVTLD